MARTIQKYMPLLIGVSVGVGAQLLARTVFAQTSPVLATANQDTNPNGVASTALQLLAYAASTFLVAALRRRRWDQDLTAILSAAIIFLLYLAASALDGTLAWPLTGQFWTGLLAAYGTQQLGYNVFNSRPIDLITTVEQNTNY